MLNSADAEHIAGKECRSKLREKTSRPPRKVQAFTYQALQRNTVVIPPPTVNIFQKRHVKTTIFSMYLKRGDIPVASTSGEIVNLKRAVKRFPVRWYCDPKNIDYCYYLPILIDGLAENDFDLRRLAMYAAMDLIMKNPRKVLPVLPKMVLPFKRAFDTRDKKIIIGALKVIQMMVKTAPCVGEALVPYYRQLLAVCNIYKNINVSMFEGIDNDRDRRIGDVIEDTLRILEQCGGPNAYINIKYMVPTYESFSYPKCTQPETPVQEKH